MSESDKNVPCPYCSTKCKSDMGLRMHITRSHQDQSSNGSPPDDLFEVLGRATEVLFPEGIPMTRVIEVADWQKATLRMMARM